VIVFCFFFFQAEDGIRDFHVTGVQTCALPICIFYKRMNKEGAIAGMVVGIVSMLLYMMKYKLGWFDEVLPDKSEWWFGISPEGFGSIAMVLNFIVSITVMKFTPQPPEN